MSSTVPSSTRRTAPAHVTGRDDLARRGVLGWYPSGAPDTLGAVPEVLICSDAEWLHEEVRSVLSGAAPRGALVTRLERFRLRRAVGRPLPEGPFPAAWFGPVPVLVAGRGGTAGGADTTRRRTRAPVTGSRWRSRGASGNGRRTRAG